MSQDPTGWMPGCDRVETQAYGYPDVALDSITARFWSSVERSADCWMWRGPVMTNGYGRFSVDPRERVYAHRFAVNAPKGTVVMHHCDVKLCVRPDHLSAGTQADNLRDMRAKGRNAHGERSGVAKLTEAAVIEIRARRVRGEPCPVLAAEFGVTPTTVSDVVRRTWRHVGGLNG